MRHLWTVLAATVVGLWAVMATPPCAARADPSGLTSTDVVFTGSGGLLLHGTVIASASTGIRRPGIVMLEGAGNRGRRYLWPEAQAYARHGMVILVYDKRTVGYSLLHRDYGVLADDALAGLRLLRSRPDVDPVRLGLWALSEGAFVAPIAANRSTEVKFLVTVGAVGTTPAIQTAWAYDQYLRHAGVSGSLPRTLRTAALPVTIGAGLFPEADFNPEPVWQQVRQPVLAQWGKLDRDSVPADSSRIIHDALDRGGNSRHTIRIVPDVNHNLHLTAADGFDRLPGLPAGYGDYEAAWITDPPRITPDPTAHLSPHPQPPAHALTPPAWYHNSWLQLAMALIPLLAFASYPLVAAARRIRRRAGHREPQPPARWLALLGASTITGTHLYLLFLLATAAKVTGPVALGRPIIWLTLQLLAVTTVGATAAVANRLWRHHRDIGTADRIRLTLLTIGGILFLPWAISWGLLAP